MKRKNFFILIAMTVGMGMIVRTFFGGNLTPTTNNPNISQYENSGFVEKLTDTGNTSDNGEISDTGNTLNLPTPQKEYTEIRVMMPKYFYNSGRKRFAQDLLDNQKVYINFIFIDDLSSYRDQLQDPTFSEADLFLFPYDRNEKISLRSFSAQQNIQPYFDPLLSTILKNNQTTFLPFSADPMIMYTISGYNEANNFYGISEFVLNRKPIRTLSFPLFFGITNEDFENKGFSREYQDIVRYALLHYFKTNNDSHDLQNRIDTNVLQKYNIQNLNTISKIITTPECKYFPSLCFQVFNFVGVRFGFLSDIDIVNLYLHDKKSFFSSIKKLQMPFSQIESPIRIWGRGIHSSLNDSETINNGVYKFIEQYMIHRTEYNLRNSTLPVFKAKEGNGLLDNEYIGLRGYILSAGGDYLNTLREINKFQELIEYKITAPEFLK